MTFLFHFQNLKVFFCKITLNERSDLLQLLAYRNLLLTSCQVFTLAFLQSFTVKIIIIFYSEPIANAPPVVDPHAS